MISDVFFPRVNGVSTSIATFRASLSETGQHDSTLIAPRYGASDPVEPDLLRVAARRVPMDPEDRLMSGQALRHTLSRIDASRVDVVHIQTPFIAHSAGVRWARAHRMPVIETWHTHFEEYFHHYVPLLPRGLLQAAARHVSRRRCNALDRIIVPSPAMKEVLRSQGIERPITVLPTGIDRREFSRGEGAAFRRRHGLAPGRPLLTYVGRVAHEKNIDFLLEMLTELRSVLPDVLLVIAGEGPALPHLRRRARDLGIADAVLFVGYLSRDGGCRTATPPAMCSCSPRERKRKVSCCSRHWPWVFQSWRSRRWARARSCFPGAVRARHRTIRPGSRPWSRA